MSPATRQFVWVMRAFVVIYLVVGGLFFFKPDFIFDLLNIAPRNFSFYTEIPQSSERFWLVLTASMMAMLCLLSLFSSFDPRNKAYVAVHLLSKTVSVLAFSYLFLREQTYFAYLVGAITDTWVALVVGGFFVRSLLSKQAAAEVGSSATG
jgi:hypothetical protein